MTLDIIVPTLGRHQKLSAFAANALDATPHPRALLFVVDEADIRTHRRLERLGQRFIVHDGTYPEKCNAGVRATEGDLIFFANDDVKFYPGWLEAATAKLTNGVGVVGTNDLHNGATIEGTYATQILVTRDYAKQGTIDGRDEVYCELYHHNWCDPELCETAQFRGAYAHAHDSHVEHVHPDHGLRQYDATDRKGQLQNREEDERLFYERRKLWQR